MLDLWVWWCVVVRGGSFVPPPGSAYCCSDAGLVLEGPRSGQTTASGKFLVLVIRVVTKGARGQVARRGRIIQG